MRTDAQASSIPTEKEPQTGLKEAPMKVQWVKKIASDGRHNAFTGLALFKERYFVAFRNGKHHAEDARGTQVLMSSRDGENWEQVHNKQFFDAKESGAATDYRDSYILNLGDELRLHSFCTPFDSAGERMPRDSKSTVQITRDGLTWTEPQMICDRAILWKPIFWNGEFWCAGYSRLPHPGPLVVDLYRSPDGLAWTKVSRITEGNETAMIPTANGLRAFVRTNKAPNHLEIWESGGDFTTWEKVGVIPKGIQAPHPLIINGECLLFGREMFSSLEMPLQPSSLRRTKAWRIQGTEAIEVLELPSCGDTSYVGAVVRPDGSLLLSYYSQHELADPNPAVDDPNSKPNDVFIASVSIG
jgi:hypothetical protein